MYRVAANKGYFCILQNNQRLYEKELIMCPYSLLTKVININSGVF